MANICLIYPRDINLDFFPLGIGYLGSYLKQKGHQVTILDISEFETTTLFRLLDKNIDIFGISITTTQLKFALHIIRIVRAHFKHSKIVCGGFHPSYFREQFIKDYGVDYVIYGEGEKTMEALCSAIDEQIVDFSHIAGLVYRLDDDLVTNAPRALIKDIDKIPFPARELVNYEAYLKPPGLIRGIWTERCSNIITSRGCPGSCTYCGANYIWQNNYRRRSVENVIAEIDLLVAEYDIDSMYFMDDTFLMNTKWILSFCDAMLSRRYHLKWSCYGRVDTVNRKPVSRAAALT